MVNVLFLVIEYAPYQTTGAFRSVYFTKYLKQFGVNPIVLTVQPEDDNKSYVEVYNPEFIKEIGENVQVVRAKLNNRKKSKFPFLNSLKMYFKINDDLSKLWEEDLKKKLPVVFSNFNPKLIYISCPPFSAANLGRKISKKYNVPYILDMRDNWSHWCVSPFASYFHYYLTYQSERKAFNGAQKIITVTEQLKKLFLKTQSQVPELKIEVIPNGFNQKINYKAPLIYEALKSSKRKVMISYVGGFYYFPRANKNMYTKWYKRKYHKIFQYSPHKENWLYRSPHFFLKTLALAFERKPLLKDFVEFHHFGKKQSWLNDMVAEFGLNEVFQSRGFLLSHELKKEIKKSDLFLSTSVLVEEGEDYAIASKTFEYIAAGKPILGFVTNGAQKEFIEKSNSGLIFDPDKIEESAERLINILMDGLQLELNQEYVEQFSRKNTAQKLANLFYSEIQS